MINSLVDVGLCLVKHSAVVTASEQYFKDMMTTRLIIASLLGSSMMTTNLIPTSLMTFSLAWITLDDKNVQ